VYPRGVDATSNASKPFIEQEALGPNRRQLGALFDTGQAPDRLLRAFFEQIKKLNRDGVVSEDLNPDNFYVEMTKGTRADLEKAVAAKTDCASCEFIIGCLDQDRIFSYADYASGNVPEGLDAILSYMELTGGVKIQGKVRVPSLAETAMNPSNRALLRSFPAGFQDRASFRAAVAVWRRQHPGPLWPADAGLDFMQEKFLEAKGFLHFERVASIDSEGNAVGGYTDYATIGKTQIPRHLVEEFWPLVNDSSRFNPFSLGGPGRSPGTSGRVPDQFALANAAPPASRPTRSIRRLAQKAA
jgi:hypothetical protein